jgi:hypothetical protein
MLPTQDRVRELFNYNKDTGIFTRKNFGKRDITYVDSNGYISGTIDSKKYRMHQIAWLYLYGNTAGSMDIDHINRDKTDNSANNLRLATRSQNQSNIPKSSNNKSGRKGVSWSKVSNKWLAQIGHNGKVTYLGLHNTVDEAYSVYCKENNKLNNEFACN